MGTFNPNPRNQALQSFNAWGVQISIIHPIGLEDEDLSGVTQPGLWPCLMTQIGLRDLSLSSL